MIQPINGHLLIEPQKYDSFVSQEKGTFEEIGVVINAGDYSDELKPGDKVYFDSWLAGKFPTGKANEFFWLVNYDDIKAIDKSDGKKK